MLKKLKESKTGIGEEFIPHIAQISGLNLVNYASQISLKDLDSKTSNLSSYGKTTLQGLLHILLSKQLEQMEDKIEKLLDKKMDIIKKEILQTLEYKVKVYKHDVPPIIGGLQKDYIEEALRKILSIQTGQFMIQTLPPKKYSEIDDLRKEIQLLKNMVEERLPKSLETKISEKDKQLVYIEISNKDFNKAAELLEEQKIYVWMKGFNILYMPSYFKKILDKQNIDYVELSKLDFENKLKEEYGPKRDEHLRELSKKYPRR